ncbi:MAG: hypothetical protein A3F16_00460 [Deltaproteobacteria bacterium RIFCSPHIGHO2_12_FULL_43_9]|nr:MAG: hypothetical protein A3F16_00460 [Deltaproteobacteria bacterium RIFCSPHIGHO2_12_FULL_43_9]
MFGKVALALLAVTAGFLILTKVFIYPSCYSFDSHDDANHAFPYNYVARQAITDGEIPTINYFNNFGAPILGDALTYPFAIQATTYYFFDGPTGMTINRFIIGILTILAAFFFMRIYLSTFPSLVCAMLTLFNPVSFWYPVHQYQMATPMFLLGICLINRLIKTKLARDFILLSILFCIMVLSVSINLIIFMIPFFIVFAFCRNNFRFDKIFIAPIVALVATLSFSFPQTFDFIRNYLTSARVDEGVYSGILTSLRELFLGIAIPPGEWLPYNYGAQLQAITYISIPVILLVISGALLIKKKRAWKQISLLFCGIIPTFIALLLYVNTDLRFFIPLVKNVDILRVLWFSMPFCFVYVGYFIAYARFGKIPSIISIPVIILSIASLLLLKLIPESSDLNPLHSLAIILIILGSIFLFFQQAKKTGFLLILLSLLLVPIPIIVRILGLNIGSCGGTQYSTDLAAAKFTPYGLTAFMEKGNRIATEIHTHKGHDLRVAQDGILGSDARGIAIDKKFGKYLENKKLVFVDQVPYGYYFARPWQTNELTKLGIRYLVIWGEHDPELDSKGWIKLSTEQNHSLFENPDRPTPIYLLDKNGENRIFLNDYKFSGNHIDVNLPNISSQSTLVITILNKYGYNATIDGKKRPIINLESGLISLNVNRGDHHVDIRHLPYPWYLVASGIIFALALIFVFSLKLTRAKS